MPGQLEFEIRRGSWKIVEASEEMVFSDYPEKHLAIHIQKARGDYDMELKIKKFRQSLIPPKNLLDKQI